MNVIQLNCHQIHFSFIDVDNPLAILTVVNDKLKAKSSNKKHFLRGHSRLKVKSIMKKSSSQIEIVNLMVILVIKISFLVKFSQSKQYLALLLIA